MNSSEKFSNKIVIVIIGTAWIVHLAMIWIYRFVPATDYPEWLYQANILAHYSDPAYQFSRWYELILVPVPNGGFILPLAILATLLPIEFAGKLFLSLYVLVFPLAVRYYFRSIDNKSSHWLISILLLFNISFLNGNFAFLFGFCLFLFTIGFLERTKAHSSQLPHIIIILLVIALFFAHAVCAFVFLIYLVVCIVEKRFKFSNIKYIIISLFLLISLGLMYYLLRPQEHLVNQFAWGFNLRYRVSVLTKSFVGGIVFPPYEFSPYQTLGNVLLFFFVASIGVYSLKELKKWFRSSVAKLTLIIMLLAVCSPKYVFGVGEPSQRFAIICFILLAGFLKTQGQGKKILLSMIIILSIIVSTVRVQGYASASSTLQRRYEFLREYLPSYPNVLTLNDGLGTSKIPFYHLIPKGINFIFQTNYHLMGGGYNPLLFRTAYLMPRYDILSRISNLMNERNEKGFLALHGIDIPDEINYIVLDSSTDWSTQMIKQLKPEFSVIAEKEIANGMKTTLLQRN